MFPWSGIGLAFLLARMAFYVAHVRRYSVSIEPWGKIVTNIKPDIETGLSA